MSGRTGAAALSRPPKTVSWLAINSDDSMGETLPDRGYGWMEIVPEELIIAIRHDALCETGSLTVSNPICGRVIFLHTGYGKVLP